MAAQTMPAEAPNRCDVVEDAPHKEKPKEPTLLNVIGQQFNAAQFLAQTAEYAKDPLTYLESRFGNTYLDQRKHLLCISEKTTIDKDIYGDGKHKAQFQSHIAKLLGKKHGLFFITGVQAQSAALKIHCDRAGNNRVAWHVSSHLESAEERAFETLYGLQRLLLGSRDEELPTVKEIMDVISCPEDQRPAAILVEIPNRVLGCQTYTFKELEEISSACRRNGVKFHCDGARLWEIEPYYRDSVGKTFADIGQLFDTLYVSFYKGLRGATGAMLVSNDESLIKESKMWQRRAGGNMVTQMFEIVDCERGYNENIGTFSQKWAKMCEVVDAVKKATAVFKTSEGKQVVSFVPDEPQCCQLRTMFQGYTADELLAARDKVQERLNIRMFNQLWPKQTLDEKLKAERAGNDKTYASSGANTTSQDDRRHFIEWMIGRERLTFKTQIYADAYVALCEELLAAETQTSN